MSDFNTNNKVVQDNSLLNSLGSLDAMTIKLFEIIVSSIDSVKPPLDNTLFLDKNDLFFMFQDTERHYTRFSYYLRRLQKQVIEIKKGSRIVQVVPIPTVEYGTKDNDSVVRIVLNAEILPYLINLKNNFTQFPISDLYAIRKKYSLILFQYAYGQFNLRSKDRFDTIHFDLTVEQLRELTGTKDILTTFSNFEKRVIKDSCDEIQSSFSSITVSYRKLKSGRNISAIRFFVGNRDIELNPINKEIINLRHKQFIGGVK